MVEVIWEDMDEVKEIIADIRDSDCDLRWVIFGYEDAQMRKLVVVEAGDTGLDDLVRSLEDDKIYYSFYEVQEKVFALVQWLPIEASGMAKARASIHRSFVTSILGNISIDIVAACRADVTQAKIDEEMSYMRATQGQLLSDDMAIKKRQDENQRKEELAKQRAMAGNTKEANLRLATLSAGKGVTGGQQKLAHVSGTNISTKKQNKSEAQSLFEAAKIDIELEDEENLRELILDLREPDREDYDDYNWMIIGYVEDKKNTLALVETGNDTREGLADYIRDELSGGFDRVMYLLIKENNAVTKMTFVSWIGKNVPALKRANVSTHRGAISSWIATIVQNRHEEFVESCSELLGLKDYDDNEAIPTCEGDCNMQELENRVQSKPYSGKVLNEVQREKTPHEQWLERKEALAKGLDPSLSKQVNTSINVSVMNDSNNVTSPDFTRFQLKSKTNAAQNTKKGTGRSRFAQQRLLKKDGETSGEGVHNTRETGGHSKAELREMARQAEEEARNLDLEAAAQRQKLQQLQRCLEEAEDDGPSQGGVDEDTTAREWQQGEIEGSESGQGKKGKENIEKEFAENVDKEDRDRMMDSAMAEKEAKKRESIAEQEENVVAAEHVAAAKGLEARAEELVEDDKRRGQDNLASEENEERFERGRKVQQKEQKGKKKGDVEEKERRKTHEEEHQKAADTHLAEEEAAKVQRHAVVVAADRAERAVKLKGVDEQQHRQASDLEDVAIEARLAAARKVQDEFRARAESEIATRRDARENFTPERTSSTEGKMPSRKAELLAEADVSKQIEEDAIRRKAEELLARKKALLEEASRKQSGQPSPSSKPFAASSHDNNQDRDRLKRAEEFRQRKMAELANRKVVDGDAAAKKAAFLREAEEAVWKQQSQDAGRRVTSMPVATGCLTAALSDDDSDESDPGTPPSGGAGTKIARSLRA